MLIRVTTTIETMVQVNDNLGLEAAHSTARKIVRDDHCAVIRLDLETESPTAECLSPMACTLVGNVLLPFAAVPYDSNAFCRVAVTIEMPPVDSSVLGFSATHCPYFTAGHRIVKGFLKKYGRPMRATIGPRAYKVSIELDFLATMFASVKTSS